MVIVHALGAVVIIIVLVIRCRRLAGRALGDVRLGRGGQAGVAGAG